MPKILVCKDPNAAALMLADLLESTVVAQPRIVLGLASGRTSSRAYRELVRRYYANPKLTFRLASTFNTDEFVGYGPDHPHGTRYFMNTQLFDHIDIRLENTHVPHGDASDLDKECKAYDALIDARGGLDLVVLGLGHNGHVCFNEPGSSPRSRTRVVDFAESTLAALSDGTRFDRLDNTPQQAITIGLATILEARRLLLIATGVGKAKAVHRIFDGRPGPAVPASLLLEHPNLTVLVDQDAAAEFRHRRPEIEVEHV